PLWRTPRPAPSRPSSTSSSEGTRMLWMIKFCITAAIAIAALRLGAGYDIHTIAITTDSQNHEIAAKYLNRGTHDTVLVGSSLTFRLSEDYFQSDDVENLALAGRSAATGLAIVAEAPTPKLVLVEANILDRILDKSFISKLTVGPPSV